MVSDDRFAAKEATEKPASGLNLDRVVFYFLEQLLPRGFNPVLDLVLRFEHPRVELDSYGLRLQLANGCGECVVEPLRERVELGILAAQRRLIECIEKLLARAYRNVWNVI